MVDRVRTVIWAESADEALDDAVAYVAAASPQAAIRLLDRVLQAAEHLSTLSERGRFVPELDDRVTRELLIGSYRLLYRVEEHQVNVLAFLHGAREFSAWLRDHRLP